MNPYDLLPPECFWRTGVAEQHPLSVRHLYRKKFTIGPKHRIATGGSCFAQHVATYLKRNGFQVLNVEEPPPGLSDEDAKRFGYIYSARYGNIYTVRQLWQLLQDANTGEVREEDIWEKDGRWYDGLRPAVEPNGLASREAVKAHRLDHLRSVLELFKQTDVFVFTLGLTEAWVHRESGTVYPMCPGTMAGEFNAAIHEFHNFTFTETIVDLRGVRGFLKGLNPRMRFILTVSPVPLTATATNNHVLVATTYSKSILRAVCGSMTNEFADVDYFPSYELIASPFARGFFFEPNMRSVTQGGVDVVMRLFFSEHRLAAADRPPPPAKARLSPTAVAKEADDLVCEEKLLEAFGT